MILPRCPLGEPNFNPLPMNKFQTVDDYAVAGSVPSGNENNRFVKTINTFPLSSTIPFMNLLCGLSWLSWLDDWTSAGGR